MLATFTDRPEPWLEMIRCAEDARFGDYQANFAMGLGKQLKQEAARVGRRGRRSALRGRSLPTAGSRRPGLHQLRLKDQWLIASPHGRGQRSSPGVQLAATPRTYVIDYSAPNVAKPMHVGHIRSTVIGDALCRTLRFLGHQVISDNHIGDWGTQFGIITPKTPKPQNPKTPNFIY